jgi:hypothetical protein
MARHSCRTKEIITAGKRSLQYWRWCWWIENRIHDLTLIFHRKPNDLGFGNNSACKVVRGAHDKVPQGAALDFRGTLE